MDHVGTISFSQSPPFLENIAPITSNVHIMLATNSLSWDPSPEKPGENQENNKIRKMSDLLLCMDMWRCRIYFCEATREDAVRVIDALGFQETSSRDVPEMLRSRGMCLPATPVRLK